MHLTRTADNLVEFDFEAFEQSLAWMNEAFKPICIDFEICAVDTLFDYNWNKLGLAGEIMQMDALIYQPHVINLFVVCQFSNPILCAVTGSGDIANPDKAFLHITKDCAINEAQLTHEMGHLFGLYDAYHNQDELVDGSNCITHGDQICDTPADPFYGNSQITWVNQDCEFIFDGLDSLGQYYKPEVGNIMAAYTCAECGFTYQQFLSMAKTWLDSERDMK